MSNLNSDQFRNIWDDHTERMKAEATKYPAEGMMPIAEARKFADPVFSPWEKFHAQEKGYIGQLAEHVKREGIIKPLVMNEKGTHWYDGNHRLAAAEVAGLTHVPWRPFAK